MKISEFIIEVNNFYRHSGRWIERGLIGGDDVVAAAVVEGNHGRHVQKMRAAIRRKLIGKADIEANPFGRKLVRDWVLYSRNRLTTIPEEPILRFQIVMTCPSDHGVVAYCGTYVVSKYATLPCLYDPRDLTVIFYKQKKDRCARVGVASFPRCDQPPIQRIDLAHTLY